MKLEKKQRAFVKSDLAISNWQSIEEYFKHLVERPIHSKEDFLVWLNDRSELDAILEEDAAWRYIRMTIDTANEKHQENYRVFVAEIQPKIAPYEHLLNEKLASCPFINELKSDSAFFIYFRSITTAIELYREQNIPIEALINEKSQEFGKISGAQTITFEGKELTMQQASMYLKDPKESIRKAVWELMAERRKKDVESLDNLYSLLVQKRHEMAINAGFDNFRDYKFKALGRFDYTKEDCFQFHSTVKAHIVPVVKKIQQRKLSQLGKEKFSPWDTEVDPLGKAPLKPFQTGKELLKGTLNMLSQLDAFFADCLSTMDQMGYLDLESKPGKAPGGYNYPLYEIGIPFIFMNSVGLQRDLVTMVHESGHAIHSILSRDLPLTGFKNLPSEVAELASMSMELLTMESWGEFYNDSKELERAKREQMESIITILPWIAQIDEFQHWIYEHPDHAVNARSEKWIDLSNQYGTGLTDWKGFEDVRMVTWQRQMHLFEVPFYYIEYGIAQLGALGIWKNYRENPSQTVLNYTEALKLGYTKTIPEIYSTAGVKFDVSSEYIQSLVKEVEELLVTKE
jgi:oligoendopeptidase F